jgi:hypothetical protein
MKNVGLTMDDGGLKHQNWGFKRQTCVLNQQTCGFSQQNWRLTSSNADFDNEDVSNPRISARGCVEMGHTPQLMMI